MQHGGFFERVATDATLLPFKDGSFDVIFCKELAHHIEALDGLMSEMWRVATPDGIIVLRESCTSSWKQGKAAEDRACKVGITHHSYTYMDYRKHFGQIARQIDVAGKPRVISAINHPIAHRIQDILIKIAQVTRMPRTTFLNCKVAGEIGGHFNEQYSLEVGLLSISRRQASEMVQ